MRTGKSYHHGNLRQALLQEAQQLLAEQGVDGLSLRRLAERAGVSRAAPYHHFADKQALLCALAVQGFQALDALMPAADAAADLEQMLAQFVADYLRFATADPELYELMFGRRLWKLGEPSGELKRVAYGTFRHYAQRIEQLYRAGAADEAHGRRGLRLAQASWATLHGLCRLLNDGIYVDAQDMQEVSALAVELLLKALRPA